VSDGLYISAEEAAERLGVSVTTLYAYVSRKGIRSQRVAGSRRRRYWKSDIDRVVGVGSPQTPARAGGLSRDTEITLVTQEGPYYRGQSATALSRTATLEETAALLWRADLSEVFSDTLPQAPPHLAAHLKLLAGASAADRATALFPFIEIANPRAYDLSHAGMGRTGADVLRWYAAMLIKAPAPRRDPLHVTLARGLRVSDDWADLIRRVLVLSADHGFEPGTYAVRAVASTGVTAYRSVLTGLSVTMGRRTRIGRFQGLARLLGEIAEAADSQDPIVQRLRGGEELPGFGSNLYATGDPRAREMLHQLEVALDGDSDFGKLKRAVRAVREFRGLEPDFALTNLYIARRVGLDGNDSFFPLGRAAGWIAHSIEQYEVGTVIREPAMYTGPLPGV
jgi:citrate synthase